MKPSTAATNRVAKERGLLTATGKQAGAQYPTGPPGDLSLSLLPSQLCLETGGVRGGERLRIQDVGDELS